jgi:hypothetical protein
MPLTTCASVAVKPRLVRGLLAAVKAGSSVVALDAELLLSVRSWSRVLRSCDASWIVPGGFELTLAPWSDGSDLHGSCRSFPPGMPGVT